MNEREVSNIADNGSALILTSCGGKSPCASWGMRAAKYL